MSSLLNFYTALTDLKLTGRCIWICLSLIDCLDLMSLTNEDQLQQITDYHSYQSELLKHSTINLLNFYASGSPPPSSGLLGNDEIPAIIYKLPVFPGDCLHDTTDNLLPAEKGGISSRRDKYFTM